MGRRCVRNGASESLVNMQGSVSCIDMIFRICDFIIFSNRLYYFLGVLLGVSWLFGRAEFPSWKLPPPSSAAIGCPWGPLGLPEGPQEACGTPAAFLFVLCRSWTPRISYTSSAFPAARRLPRSVRRSAALLPSHKVAAPRRFRTRPLLSQAQKTPCFKDDSL